MENIEVIEAAVESIRALRSAMSAQNLPKDHIDYMLRCAKDKILQSFGDRVRAKLIKRMWHGRWGESPEQEVEAGGGEDGIDPVAVLSLDWLDAAVFKSPGLPCQLGRDRQAYWPSTDGMA